jgi:hypothetical protein
MPIIAGRASAAYGAGFGAVTTPPYLGPFGAYDALATVIVPSGGLSTITFAGIPQTGYDHLQIRGISKTTSGTDSNITINNGVAAVYRHQLACDGAGISSFGNTNNAFIIMSAGSSGTNIYDTSVIDFLDYSSNTKTKVVRAFSGRDLNGSGLLSFGSALFNTADSINSNSISNITLTPSSGSFVEFTSFSLYGVK